MPIKYALSIIINALPLISLGHNSVDIIRATGRVNPITNPYNERIMAIYIKFWANAVHITVNNWIILPI